MQVGTAKMKSTKVQTLGELRMCGTANALLPFTHGLPPVARRESDTGKLQ